MKDRWKIRKCQGLTALFRLF